MCVEWDKISKQSAVLAERLDYSRARNSAIPNIASWRDDNQKRNAEVVSLRAQAENNLHLQLLRVIKVSNPSTCAT